MPGTFPWMEIRYFPSNRLHHSHINQGKYRIPTFIHAKTFQSKSAFLMPLFSGGIFPTVPVTVPALPPPVAVPVHLVCPHTNPSGQQPPPRFAEQLVQPLAHLPLAVPEAGVTAAGTTI